LPLSSRQAIFASILQGVALCHSQGFAHTDLKPENILISSDFIPVIADFGTAMDDNTPLNQIIPRYTPGIGAPEQMKPTRFRINKERHWIRTDMWSLGVLLHDLIFDV
jgi:serine/threonine protein kinase